LCDIADFEGIHHQKTYKGLLSGKKPRTLGKIFIRLSLKRYRRLEELEGKINGFQRGAFIFAQPSCG
jgi:hypothetical protein